MIDPRLRTLRMLRELGTVTAAAYALHLTPSTVSQQIKQLARSVDAPLVVADGRRVRLTPAAEILLRHGDALAAQWETALAELAEHRRGELGLLRVCGLTSVLAAVVAPTMARLRAEQPGVRTRMTPAESHECFPLLLAGEADIGVFIPTEVTPSTTDARFALAPLVRDEQDLIVPPDHRLAGRAAVALAETAAERWIGMRADLNQHHVMTTATRAAGFSPVIDHVAGDWQSATAMVALGFGVALLPRMVPVPAEHRVVRVRLRGEPSPTRRIHTAIRRGSAGQPMVGLGLAALRETVR